MDGYGWKLHPCTEQRKFRSTPSQEKDKGFRKKFKNIVNKSNYAAKIKAEKLAPILKGWRTDHRSCKIDSARHSLWFLRNRAFKVFNQEKSRTVTRLRN
ncbi:MAG: hypothetical protein F6K56_03690 [Moorea sp. SIO3G5]|nr:hypothetical protein [Moorena sp. SIO3G5]